MELPLITRATMAWLIWGILYFFYYFKFLTKNIWHGKKYLYDMVSSIWTKISICKYCTHFSIVNFLFKTFDAQKTLIEYERCYFYWSQMGYDFTLAWWDLVMRILFLVEIYLLLRSTDICYCRGLVCLFSNQNKRT